jgi:hypothetical protein
LKGNIEIERRGMEVLKRAIKNEFPNKDLHYWDKAKVAEYGCDLVFSVDEKDYFIELKASSRHPYRDNLRMTPSTIARCLQKGVLQKLIVALVTDVFSDKEQYVTFIPFSNIESDKLFVDVKFGFKPHHVREINFSRLQEASTKLDDKGGVEKHLQYTLAQKLGVGPL